MLGIKPRTSCIFTKHSHNIICYLCFPLPLPQHCCCHWHLVFCLLLFFRFTFSFLFLPFSSFFSSLPFQWFIYGGKGSLFWCCWWLKGIHHLKASIPAEQKRMQRSTVGTSVDHSRAFVFSQGWTLHPAAELKDRRKLALCKRLPWECVTRRWGWQKNPKAHRIPVSSAAGKEPFSESGILHTGASRSSSLPQLLFVEIALSGSTTNPIFSDFYVQHIVFLKINAKP